MSVYYDPFTGLAAHNPVPGLVFSRTSSQPRYIRELLQKICFVSRFTASVTLKPAVSSDGMSPQHRGWLMMPGHRMKEYLLVSTPVELLSLIVAR
jgi:hypothetical protein